MTVTAYERTREKTALPNHTNARRSAPEFRWRAAGGRAAESTYMASRYYGLAAVHGRERQSTLRSVLRDAVLEERGRMVSEWRDRARRAVAFAESQRGRPYIRGGTGPRGYDCSGLVQRSWARAGVAVPRVTYSQFRGIRTHVTSDRLSAGDLVFFDGLGHVGMYVGRGRFIHSPRPGRRVTVERLRGYWHSRLVGAVRPGWPRLPELPDWS